MIVIQQIITTWSKEERGGKAAVYRNALPQQLLIPVSKVREETPACITHCISSSGFTYFIVPELLLPSSGEIKLVIEGGLLHVAFGRNLNAQRHKESVFFGNKFKCTLKQGQWIQAIGMRRDTAYETTWCYRKEVFNIGLTRNKYHAKDFFLHKSPDYQFHPKVEWW